MPYHKDKHIAFMHAQEGFRQAQEAHGELVRDSADFGRQLSHLKQEVNEAYQQIENALETAGEIQRDKLEKFKADLAAIVEDVNQFEG